MKPLAIACLLAFLSVFRAAAENEWYVGVDRTRLPLVTFRPERDLRLPVEYFRQKGPLCLSTAAAAALRYYGTEIEPERLRQLGKWDPVTGKLRDLNDGSTFWQIQDALRQIDYHWPMRVFPGDHEGFRQGMVEIREQILKGRPVIIGAYFAWGEAHAVLIYGYDDLTQLVYILDSALGAPGKRLLTTDEFEVVWNLELIGSPVRAALFTLPKGESPAPACAGPIIAESAEIHPPPPPSPPTPPTLPTVSIPPAPPTLSPPPTLSTLSTLPATPLLPPLPALPAARTPSALLAPSGLAAPSPTPAPPPPPPLLTPFRPVVGPAKTGVDNRTGGFRPPSPSRTSSRDRNSPNAGPAAEGRRSLLKPFLP
jgi:hypothetical protein